LGRGIKAKNKNNEEEEAGYSFHQKGHPNSPYYEERHK
jgi:hypothetical protein